MEDEEVKALLDRPFTELTHDELRALKAYFDARGVAFYNAITPAETILLGLVGLYSKTFVETLAKGNAEALIEAVRTRFRKKGKATEALVGPDDGSAAVVVLTSDIPDEARLALLDMDLTAENLPGQLLRWNAEGRTWRPGT